VHPVVTFERKTEYLKITLFVRYKCLVMYTILK